MATTLAYLKEHILERSDMVGSQFVSDNELGRYINLSATELYDMLLAAYGNDYFVADGYQFCLVPGQEKYQLPTDFYKLVGVEVLSGDNAYTLERFNFQERNHYRNTLSVSNMGIAKHKYRLMGNRLMFVPKPADASTVIVYYAPKMAELSETVDLSDTIPEGWAEYVIVDVCIKLLTKAARLEELGPYVLQKNDLKVRIEKMAEFRDWGSPERVKDTSKINSWYFEDFTR